MLSIAIIGLPNVGKSTLFNALTDSGVLAANYPFATIEPNTGIVPVPDERLSVLARMFKTNKIVPATVKFVDVAGLVEGASKGEGLGNKFLANIRECDAIVHVVRAFRDHNVQHVSNAPDPRVDIEIINTELILADIQSIETHLPKVEKLAKADPSARAKVEYLQYLQNELMAGRLPESRDTSRESRDLLDGLQLLTMKPVIYLFNIDENTLTDEKRQRELCAIATPSSSAEHPTAEHDSRLAPPDSCLFVCAKLESELRGLSKAEAEELSADYSVDESGLAKLVRSAYRTLGLQSFLTAGEKEIRAWTIHAGWTAPQAAGVIHTDFERGFIAAQVVNYDDLVKAGSESAARSAGKIRTEGRNYIMQPNDVVEFRFNV